MLQIDLIILTLDLQKLLTDLRERALDGRGAEGGGTTGRNPGPQEHLSLLLLLLIHDRQPLRLNHYLQHWIKKTNLFIRFQ